jgi:hypothetical protein
MSQPEQISFVALGVMIVSSIGFALWARYLRRSIVSAPRLFQSPRVGCLHVLGCVVFLVLGVGQSAIAQALGLFSVAVFLLVTCVALFQRSRLNLHIAGMSALLSLVWLAYWLHETQLAVWMKTVDTPIRVDFFVTAPLLYFTTMVFLSVAFKGEALPGSAPSAGSGPSPST